MRTVERLIRHAAPIALALLLAACGAAPPGLVRADHPTKVARVMEVTSPIEWARYRSYNSELWTVDGAALNRIVFIAHIRDKYHVLYPSSVRATKRRPDGPYYRTGMDASELEGVLRDAIIEAGLANVESSNLHPVQVGDTTGFRFDLSFDSGSGLHYLGSVTFFEHKKKLNVIWHSAPAEYYYPRDAKAVEQMLANLRIRK